MDRLESEITHWRTFIQKDGSLDGREVEELDAHLRDQIADLVAAGLASDEAFLVAVKRLGSHDQLSREFAREHSGRLWRQLVGPVGGAESEAAPGWPLALGLAVAAAGTVKAARLAAGFPAEEASWLIRNASLLVLPFLAGYFARQRRLSWSQTLLGAAPFVIAAVVINLYPYVPGGSTEALGAAHLPAVLWFAVAYPYMGGVLRSHEQRMDYVRFTGEWFIYYVLIALGGGVLLGLMTLILEPAGVGAERIIQWVAPPGAAGAVIVAAWLVEAKQRVVENMAPVLTMLFTPLFALMLTGAAVVYVLTGLGEAFDRELLGVFDALLVVVLGLVLYGLSARDPSISPGWMDRIQLVAVVSALVLDVIVLGTMIARIGQVGLTPNRTAALGLNVLLLVSLAGSARLSLRFLSGAGTFHHLERWQTTYLPVFALWAAIVVVVFPPLFAWI